MALKSVDIIDRGIAEAFLGLAPHECNMALSGDARHLALARSHQLLLMPQQFAAIEGPLLVPLPAGAEVCRLCWLWADEEFILIVGSSSGHVCAFTPAGAHLGTRLPEVEAGLELPSAVLQLETQFTDGEPELLCLFEGGSVLCTSARALREGGKIAVYDLPPSHRQEEAHQCRAIVCCGVMSPLPLDLTPTPSAAARLPVRPRGCSHYSEVSLVFVSTQHSSLSLLTIEGSTPTSAVVATLADVAAPATEGSRISRGLGAFQSMTSSLLRAATGVTDMLPDPCCELTCERQLFDPPRQFVHVVLEPCCQRWIAAADSRGRVTLLEARSLVALRVWKGYRDAQCGWTDLSARLSVAPRAMAVLGRRC